MRVIGSVYPEPAIALTPEAAALHEQPAMPSRVVEHGESSEIVLAVDLSTLVALARRYDGMIELVPQVGDFIAEEEPLFVLHGGATAIEDRAAAVDGGFRPRTHARAGPDVRVPDHRRHRPEGAVAGDQRSDDRRARPRPGAPAAADGGPAQAARRGHPRRHRAAAPHLPHAELGGLRPRRLQRDSRMRRHNLQVVRRMRAMLENLRSTLPAHRHAALEGSSTCWTGRSRRTSAGPRSSHWPAFPIRRDWADRRACA